MKKANTATAAPATENAAPVKTKSEMRKEALTRAAAIGGASTPEQRVQLCMELIPLAPNECAAAVLTAYTAANQRTSKASSVKTAHAVHGTMGDGYAALVMETYFAALKYADENSKAAKSALFNAWKAYLAFTFGETIKADGEDSAVLRAAATRETAAAIEYSTYTKKNGDTAARLAKGIRYDSAAALAGFTRKLERVAVERYAAFDGILSRNDSAAARERNKDLKESALAAAAPVSVETSAPVAEEVPAAAC